MSSSSPSPFFGNHIPAQLASSSPDYTANFSLPHQTGTYGSHPLPSSFPNDLHLQANLGPSNTSFSDIQVEQLEIHDLMRNRHVLALYNRLDKAMATVFETTQQNNRLLQEITDLKAKVNLDRGLPQISSSRPDKYPESVLWLEGDCRNDPDVRMSASNPSRIPMNAAIRYEDGRIIESATYDGIRASGTMIIHRDLLSLPPASDRRGPTAPRTQSYFRTFYPKEWSHAIHKLEQEQPLLALCAGSWKAKHLLGSLLTSINQSQKNNQDGRRSKSAKASENLNIITNSNVSVISSGPSESTTVPNILGTASNNLINDDGPPNDRKRPLPQFQPDLDHSAIKEDLRTLKKAKSSISDQSTLPNSALVSLKGLANSVSLDKSRDNSSNVNVDFIVVRSTFDNLKDIFHRDYPQLASAKDLLAVMKANPQFNHQDPSPTMIQFLTRIETADPNDPNFDEDNLGAGWGHYQFTSGSLSCSTVLTSWSEVGNTDIACRLIAASIRTAKIARYLCEEKKIKATSYIADTYIERVIESLLAAWKSTPGAPAITTVSQIQPTPPAKSTVPASNTDTTSLLAEDEGIAGVGDCDLEAVQPEEDGKHSGNAVKSTEEILKLFQNKELKAWILLHHVSLVGPVNKQRANKDLIAAIMNDSNCAKPTELDLANVIAARVPKKKRTAQAAPAGMPPQ